ncbi:hypothetical protein SLEP1_g55174 [Rubroshorea leprosula]|uniref:Uncharacterized protein n=1 Tax=Rubroshorea leprosula TaxID=152421 RepID=A0AAV5MIE3_9ROSI|nr:hypothetical protein SLEP1_g55174 [Rubroshorea leprosula]
MELPVIDLELHLKITSQLDGHSAKEAADIGAGLVSCAARDNLRIHFSFAIPIASFLVSFHLNWAENQLLPLGSTDPSSRNLSADNDL